MILKEAIQLAAKYASKRPGHPVLACIRSTGNTLEAFDQETAISIKIPPTPVFCTNGEMLKKFTSKLDKFAIAATEEAIQITGQGSNQIATIDPAEFPYLPEVTGEPFTLWESKLFKAWTTVKPAIKPNHTRRMFQGVSLKIRDNVATLSGTDGHKAAQAEFRVTAPDCDVTIPVKFFEILKTKSDRELMIAHDVSNISMAIGDITITSRLLEGSYPNLPTADNTAPLAVLEPRYRSALMNNLAIAKAMGADAIDLYIRGQELILKCFTTDSKTERYEINTPTPTHLYFYAMAIASPITQYASYHQAIEPSSWYRRGYGMQHSEGREAHLSFSLSYEFIANTLKFVLPIAAQADQQARIGIDNLVKILKATDKDRDITIALDTVQDVAIVAIGSLGKNNASILTVSKEAPAPYGEILEFKSRELMAA